MTIKSVREINFFQTLRDRELNITFYNSKFNKTDEEIKGFINILLKMAQEEIKKNQVSQLTHMEEQCITTLVNKIENETLKLTFIEAIHLHNILDYFENNYDIFTEYTKNKNVVNELKSFITTPATFYNTIFNMKNDIEFKLGEMVTHSYKFKHK